MSRFNRVFLPKLNCYTSGGRGAAQYHFYGFYATGEVRNCAIDGCSDCAELNLMFDELCAVDSSYRREWMKLIARMTRVPQRASLHAAYRRKRGNQF